MPCYRFARGAWNPEELPMTYTPMCRDYVSVRQEEDCIASGMNPSLGDYDYIGLAMTKPLTGEHTVTARFSFAAYGAPLIVLADSVHTDDAGRRFYGAFHEIVAWEGGCNVWRITPVPDPEKNRPYTVQNLTREKFDVPAGEILTMTVRVGEKKIDVTLGEHTFSLDTPDLPASYTVGITLCEGENRFYDLHVD